MDESRRAEFEQKLAGMRARYRADLPERHTLILGFQRKLLNGSFTPEDAQSLAAIAHKLAGSGATYGFPEIGVAANQLEVLIEDEPDCRLEIIADHVAALMQACTIAITDKAETGT